MARRPRVPPERILHVAALEFAERGFAGARVDRIARRARVNKAMLYYHFGSKAGLYRTLLRGLFAEAGQRLDAIARSDQAPGAKMDQAITALAGFLQGQAFVPQIMLREIVEGGAHLDSDTIALMAVLPRAFASIVAHGVRRGAFANVHPLFAYVSVVAPIAFYLASGPIRDEVLHRHLVAAGDATPDAFVAHVKNTVQRMLAHDGAKRSL